MAKSYIPSSISAHSAVSDSLVKLVALRLKEIETLRTRAGEGDIDAVHDMRVTCRRLQTTFRVFKPCFHKKRVKKIMAMIHSLIAALGEVRENDVLIERITFGTKFTNKTSQSTLWLLLGRITLQRNKARQDLAGLLNSAGSMEILSSFGREIHNALSSPLKQPHTLGEFYRETIPGLFNEFVESAKIVINHPQRKIALHKLRIQGKPLRYTMECAEPCFNKDFKDCYREVKSVITLLGEIHDDDLAVEMLRSWLAEIRALNTAAGESGQKTRIPVDFISTAITAISKQRKERFSRLETILHSWQAKHLSARIAASLSRIPHKCDAYDRYEKE